MTPAERQQINALARCRFGLRAFDKRFARDLSNQVRRGDCELSNRQRFALARIVYRYRRQLAGRLPEELQILHPPVAVDYGIEEHPETVDDLFTGEASPPHKTDIGTPDTRRQKVLF